MAPSKAAFEYAVEPQLPPSTPHPPQVREQVGFGVVAGVELAVLAPETAALRHNELRVVLDAETDRGTAELELPLRVERRGPDAWRVHGVAYRLTLDIETADDRGEIHWNLEPGGRDAAARARTIDLLRTLSGQGVLVLRDPDSGVLARMHLPGQAELDVVPEDVVSGVR